MAEVMSAGAGPDSLVLRISQDAWQGNAQYVVRLDGQQIGGTFTASAAHGSGESDTLTLQGDWAAGPHQVEIAFLNDDYGGTPATDRNLHLDGASYNGTAVAGAVAALWDGTPTSFTFTEGGGTSTGSGQVAAPAGRPPSGPAPDATLARPLHLTFNDDFNSFSWDRGGPNGASDGTWNTVNGWGRSGPQSDRLEFYSDASVGVDPFRIEDGALVISANPSADPSRTAGEPYTSGVITTKGNFEQHYGYFEMRADVPEGKGLWPAFWMVPGYRDSPPELDVMEMIGSKADVTNTMHSTQDGDKHWFDWTPAPTVFDGYHTFGVSWRPDGVDWYYDGEKTFSAPNPSDFDGPMYMIANLAIGGNWPGSPDGSTPFPAEMKIDHIRAWQYDDLV